MLDDVGVTFIGTSVVQPGVDDIVLGFERPSIARPSSRFRGERSGEATAPCVVSIGHLPPRRRAAQQPMPQSAAGSLAREGHRVWQPS